jgi:Mannosylglycerate hydrolase MGH1-like glycoside hydrolase domain
MRDWSLGPGDPLALTLAADFRLSTPDYANDHIWELELGGGDPSALALRTTFGLRARLMRIFPRFTLGGQTATDPAAFAIPPRLRRFYPSFLLFEFSPFPGLEALAEYWVPTSQTAAGRFTLSNRGTAPLTLQLELCGQLVPLGGQSLTPLAMQSVNILAGRTADLAPVIFLTGGSEAGPGPYPSLILELTLPAGLSHQYTWAQAALGDAEASFELARATAARPWDAERAKLELVNAAQAVEVYTGDPDWDAALALSQKAAFGLFFAPSQYLPWASFVEVRQPDYGYSPHGTGSDYSYLWSGQSPLEAYYLAGLLPGASGLAAGLLRNFLAVQSGDGAIDCKPGLAGQRGPWTAAPFLASLAWQAYQSGGDKAFLAEAFPRLLAFNRLWLTPAHDRDGDGFPEWDHPLQTSFEDNLAFTVWHAGGQGADISVAESPALAAALCRESQLLAHMASLLGRDEQREPLELQAAALRGLAEECWDADAALYHTRDRDSHLSPRGRLIARQRGPGRLSVRQEFNQPARFLVEIQFKGEATFRPEAVLKGRCQGSVRTERLERKDFQWGAGIAVATTRSLYTSLTSLAVTGLSKHDHVILRLMDFSTEDQTLFLPLWAEIPTAPRAAAIVNRTLFAADRFGRPFGTPTCCAVPYPASEGVCMAVHLPWNQLIGEGLLAYGLRTEAAQLTARLMNVVIENLRKQRAFARAYHAESGAGIGERNALQGLAPLGLFLKTLGVEIHSPMRVALSGKNPFPWPVTVKYRGLTVTRQADQSVVVFPGGQSLTLNDPTEGVVSTA